MPRGLTTLIVIAVIVGSALLGQQKMKSEPVVTERSPSEEPGYSARDAELIETGDDGRPLYRLRAAVVKERPAEGAVHLEQVTMSYRGENSNQWSVNAAAGLVRQADAQIELSGGVRAMGVFAGSTDLAQITTDALSFDSRTQIASADGLATLRLGQHQIRGTGLRANFKDQQVRLISDVHGQFIR